MIKKSYTYIYSIKPQLKLCLGIVAIIGFMFGLAPWLIAHSNYQTIKAKEIDTGALFYTESEEADENVIQSLSN